MINCERLSQQPSKNERAQEPMSRSLQLCHGICTDWSIFGTPLLLWKKGSCGPVTQWRQLVSCDWSGDSHGRFYLKINPSMKTLWQEYSGVACSFSSAPVEGECYQHHVILTRANYTHFPVFDCSDTCSTFLRWLSFELWLIFFSSALIG